MEQQREMNFFDLCKVLAHWLVKCVKWLVNSIGAIIRLTFRKWWIVLIIMALSIAAALYYSRHDNRIYKVNAIATLNGVTADVVRGEFENLSHATPWLEQQNLATMLHIDPALAANTSAFRTFDVIDCLGDSIVDYVDYKGNVTRTDTMYMHMSHTIALQFRTRRPNDVPQLEEAILNYLNSRPYFQQKYTSFRNDLERTARFHRDQVDKLDSLTTRFYFDAVPTQQVQLNSWESGVILGNRQISLFLEDVYPEIRAMENTNDRLATCTAPVVLQSHFSVDPRAVNRLSVSLLWALVIGWMIGLLLAALVENWKALLHWLRQ